MEEKITYTEKEGLIVLFANDEKFIIDYGVAANFGVQKGISVDKEELLSANRAYADKAAVRYGLDSLAKSDKTVKQMYKKLKAKFFQTESVEHALNKLIEAGYLNDARFCENFIGLSLQSGKGRNYIKNKLLEKGVPSAVVEQWLEGFDSDKETANAVALLKRQNELLQKYPHPVRKEKLMRKAVSAGFSTGSASSVINELFSLEEPADFDDYFTELIQKKFKRLKGKYTPEEIKRRLYAEFLPKGAERSLIDRCMEES